MSWLVEKKGSNCALGSDPAGEGVVNNVIGNLRTLSVIARAPASSETEVFTVPEVAAALLCGRLTQHAGLHPEQAARIDLNSEREFPEPHLRAFAIGAAAGEQFERAAAVGLEATLGRCAICGVARHTIT